MEPGRQECLRQKGFSDRRKVFVPFSEELMEKLGLGLDDLVPFDIEYEVLRPAGPRQELSVPVQKPRATEPV